MATRGRRSRSLEEAEIRKLEAEATEIEVRTVLRVGAFLLLLAVLSTHMDGIANLLGRWVAAL